MRRCEMRRGRLSSWAAALAMAAGGPAPGLGGWAMTLGAHMFQHTNNGRPAPDWM